MKYLKKFPDVSESKEVENILEDLSEYLQELFDKYGVIEHGFSRTGEQKQLQWYLRTDLLQTNHPLNRKGIIIEGYTQKDIVDIGIELEAIKESLEYRLGYRILINKGPYFILLSIDQRDL